MGFISQLLGSNAGPTQPGNFSPQQVTLQPGATADQVAQGNDQANMGLGQQQQFLQALQSQNGIGNQNSVFGQQQALANQLQQQANGQGPNPALQQLSNTTGQNIANQSALMAGQRGAGSNVGLIGRQAAQQGAGIQQQAVGQAALQRSQQQLAAQQQLQQQQGMLGNIASNQIGNQAQAGQFYNQAAQGEQGQLQNALNENNRNNLSQAQGINSVNAAEALQNAKTNGQVTGGLLGGIASGLGAIFAHGGQVPYMADGGQMGEASEPSSNAGKFLGGFNSAFGAPASSQGNGKTPVAPSISQDSLSEDFSQVGKQAGKGFGSLAKNIFSSSPEAMGPAGAVGPAEAMGPAFSKGGDVGAKLKVGGKVPGKAQFPGDTLKNDTVKAQLSPGEIVVPRSHSGDPEKAAAFVRAVIAKNKGLKHGV